MAHATSLTTLAPGEAVEVALATLEREGQFSAQTLARFVGLMWQFAGFAERGHGIRDLQLVTPDVVRGYLCAPTSDGARPGLSLQHFRRLAVRLLYRTCRQLELVEGDPTLDVVLPPRSPGAFRPLEDDEVELCRAAAAGSGRRMRLAAAWALCEATGRTGELPALVLADVDLAGGRVWLHGSPRTLPRWGQLTEWGAVQLGRYLSSPAGAAGVPILGTGEPGSALAQSTAVGLICQTLTHAGLGGEPDVRPASVVAWAGRGIFEETGRIETAAQRLGMRSLDRTARFIGWDWSVDGA